MLPSSSSESDVSTGGDRLPRRERSLQNARLLHGHGVLTGTAGRVPRGTSVIFMTRAGTVSRAIVTHLASNAENVNRIIADRFTPFGHRIYTKRYDAGQEFPDAIISRVKEKGDVDDPGIYRLPLSRASYPNYDRGLKGGSIAAWKEKQAESVAQILRRGGPGQYLVTACRRFPDDTTDEQRSMLLELEARRRQQPRLEPRSDPESLSNTSVSDSRSGDSARDYANSAYRAIAANNKALIRIARARDIGPLHVRRPRQRKGQPSERKMTFAPPRQGAPDRRRDEPQIHIPELRPASSTESRMSNSSGSGSGAGRRRLRRMGGAPVRRSMVRRAGRRRVRPSGGRPRERTSEEVGAENLGRRFSSGGSS